MRWNAAHSGNIRQAPLEGQDAVNPDLKVPDPDPDTPPEEVEAEPQTTRTPRTSDHADKPADKAAAEKAAADKAADRVAADKAASDKAAADKAAADTRK